MEIIYDKVSMPVKHENYIPVDISVDTMKEHRKKVIAKIEEYGLDVLMIYADREHGANFAYLTGFEPRFEEAVLILHKDGGCYLLLGNENLKMSKFSFIQGEVIHVPHFSLPYQPMEPAISLRSLISQAGICDGMKIGCVGWKLFTSVCPDDDNLIDIPYFIIDAVRSINPNGSLNNAAQVFLDSKSGLRVKVNANEVAHYEFGAGLASSKILDAINNIDVGKTEMDIAQELSVYGQPVTVTTICASGERFVNAVVFPRHKRIQLGERFSVTLGLRGGLSSRTAYVARNREDLPDRERGYVENVVIPYYRAAVAWYETVGLGVSCDTLYKIIESVLPKSMYHWTLNPGHYTGADEWTSSPVYEGSDVVLESGMLLQMDIIPSVPEYGGTGAEDGVALADEKLRAEICNQYPEVWERIVDRRRYIKNVLNIELKDEVLPLSDICGYLRPLLLNHEYALKKK